MSRLFSLIQSAEVRLAAGKKVIPLADFTQILEAQEVLEKAKADAAALLEKTEEHCRTLQEEAKQLGFQEGLVQLNEKILSLAQEKKRLRHEMNKLILPLALKAAKKIVARELETHPETIVDIVLQALAPVMQNQHITIYLNKADREMVEAEKPRLKEKLESVETFVIQDRDDVSPGGCIIKTESGIINATIENQWRAIETAFDRYFKSASPSL